MSDFAFRVRPESRKKLEAAVGAGMLNLGGAIETAAKGHAPVRGGFRSFAPNGPVGGTLRRSIHAALYFNGQRISPQAADQNGTALPAYAPAAGWVLYVGTNSGYGLWVHEGTRYMPGRPFLREGFTDVRPRTGQLLAAGARRSLGS